MEVRILSTRPFILLQGATIPSLIIFTIGVLFAGTDVPLGTSLLYGFALLTAATALSAILVIILSIYRNRPDLLKKSLIYGPIAVLYQWVITYSINPDATAFAELSFFTILMITLWSIAVLHSIFYPTLRSPHENH